jgi:Heparinase II/III-like protein/Heparinase II/III N-terminus
MLLIENAKLKITTKRITPKRVFCVVEEVYQSLETAESACCNRFTNAGVTLDLGDEINWLENPLPHDEEWQIEQHKFYFGLDLAHAFCKTGERRFAQTWQNLVSKWIRQTGENPAKIPAFLKVSDVAARRVQNWIYAWMLFTDAPHFRGFSENFTDELLKSLHKQIRHLRANLTAERNHRTLEIYALFVAALALPQIDKGGELLRFSMDALHENLLTDIQSDGVHREQSTHYHCTVLRSFLGAKENARRFGLSFAKSFDERLIKACEFAMHIHRPDGAIPALSDSDTGSYKDLLKLAGELFARPDFLYAATDGREGIAPKKSNISFKSSGYFIQRSGWGDKQTAFANERFLIFDCGKLGDGGHGHYDLLNVEVAANGKPLIVDSGRYTYSETGEPNWRRYFKNTKAHNTVCVDDSDQTNYRRGKPKGEIARGEFIERIQTDDLDVLCGAAFSPNYDTVHTRKIYFIKNRFWLIHDNLRGAETHKFDLRFHLTPAAWNHCRAFQTETNAVVRTSEVALIFEKHRPIVIEPDWFSPNYGIKHRAPCVSIVEKNAAEADFYTLVAPINLKDDLPTFTVENSGDVTTIEIFENAEKHTLQTKNL